MNIKDFQKSASLIKRLEDLDKEIEQIGIYALKVKDNSLSLQLNLSYDKPKSIEEGGYSYSFDEAITSPFRGILSNIYRQHAPAPDNTESFKTAVSEVVTLEILGVIVAHKEAERMCIISQLRNAGIAVEI